MSNHPVTVPGIRARKGGETPIVMLTAYDTPTARIVEQGGVDIVLVGDSLANVVLGYDSTLPVTLEEMLHHVKAARRGLERCLLVADMPFLSYGITPEESLRSAGRFVKEGGAQAVKVEGGRSVAEHVRRIVRAEIPVMGHLGLTPQAIHRMGGYRVQGKTADSIRDLLEDARALEEAGAFAMVLEGMPEPVAQAVTRAVGIPTIGIGAGAGCDGQVLVFHDLLGLDFQRPPRFVRQYANLAQTAVEAIQSFRQDVQAGRFPTQEHSYPVPRSLDLGEILGTDEEGAS